MKKERNKEREGELAWSWKQSRRFNPTRLRSLPGNFSSSPSSPSRFIPPPSNHFSLLLQQTTNQPLYARVYIYIYTLSTGLYTCVRACIQEKSEMGKRKEREREGVLLLFAAIFVHSHSGRIESWIWVQATRTYTRMIVRSLPHSRRSQKLAVSKSPLPDSPGCIGIGGDVRAPLPEGGEGGGGGDETAS